MSGVLGSRWPGGVRRRGMKRERADAGVQARETYDAFASSYDEFNHRYKYERWTGKLLERAEAGGLAGDRLLDVGCGTGLSFVSMLDRGFEVTGCDISPAMLARAKERAEGRATLLEADMRELPVLGEFDMVWAVNDAINYLLEASDLRNALTGMRRNLASGGIVLFDVNTLAVYRSFFTGDVQVDHDGRRFSWAGRASIEAPPGSIFEAGFDGEGAGVTAHVHRQRHFPEAEVRDAIGAVGLRLVEVAGELDGELSPGVDEELHTKAVYVCADSAGRPRSR